MFKFELGATVYWKNAIGNGVLRGKVKARSYTESAELLPNSVKVHTVISYMLSGYTSPVEQQDLHLSAIEVWGD